MISLKIAFPLALICVVSARNNPYYHQFEGASNFGRSNNGFGGGYSGGSGARIPILSYENVNDGNGNYRYSYETGNGISAHESGSPRAAGPEGLAVTADGGYSYRAPDGQQISLTYTADENGFHPVGSHLPTPPPIPEAILSSDNGAYNNGGYNSGAYNNGRYNNNNGGYNY